MNPRHQANLGRSLKKLGKYAVASEVDNIMYRGCISKIVNLVILVLILACLAVYVGGAIALNKTGLADKLPSALSSALAAGFFLGFLAAIIIGGLVGNWLRRRLWRIIRRVL